MKELESWITNQGAIVEYEDEVAYIMNNKKLVFNRAAEELWGTRIKGMREGYRMSRNSRLEELRKWAMNDLNK